MAHWSKTFRRYERHFLIALVVLLLAAFSVTSALKQCSAPQGPASQRLGGSSQATPKQRVEISDTEMLERTRSISAFTEPQGNVLTLEYEGYGLRSKSRASEKVKQAWMHVMVAEAAKAAGYKVGDKQLREAVKQVISRVPQMGGMQGTQQAYERFLTQIYGGPATAFEAVLREVVAKDELLSVFVDSQRFEKTQAELYEDWKTSAERVDLRFVAAEAASFAAEVREEEESKRTMSKQEDLLRQVWETSGRMKTLQTRLEEYRKAKSTSPESLSALISKEPTPPPWSVNEAMTKDSWGNPIALERTGDGVVLRSSGPDGVAGNADDVTPALHAEIDSHRRLAKVAEAVVRWRNGADPKQWPPALDVLTKAPPREAQPGKTLPPMLAPLATLEKDAWGRDFVYELGTGDAPPALSSLGLDGQPNTADDIRATIDTERARVSPGSAFAPYLVADLKDTWGRPLRVHMRTQDQGFWDVVSDGRDGQPGTPDDLVGGNRPYVERFYNDGAVKTDFRQPVRRRFKSLVLHLPLVTDERLRRLWLDHPDLRPSKAEEERLFEDWNKTHGPDETYAAVDPRDPETGHGAAFAKRLKEALKLPADAPVTLVPAKTVFEVPGAPPAPAPEAPAAPAPAPAPGDPAPAPAPAPGAPPVAAPVPAPPDPKRKEYEEKGWREILLRHRFLENVLNHHWQEVVSTHRALAAWEKAGIRTTPRPKVVTLEELLSDERLGKYQPTPEERARGERFLEWFETGTEPLTDKEMNALPLFQDPRFASHPSVSSLRSEEPASIPVPLNERQTTLLYFNLEYLPERTPDLKEVEAKVFDRYVEREAFNRAERELQALQRDIEKRTTEKKEGDTDESIWNAALTAWKEARPKAVVHDEKTGMFIGSRPPVGRVRSPVGSTDAEKAERAARLRRDFVRQTGYELVRPSESRQDTTTATPLSFGRKLGRDESQGDQATHSVYLVRVNAQAYPTKAEFSPTQYADALRERVFGRMDAASRRFATGDRPGALNQSVATYLEDIDRLRPIFDLRTNSNLDQIAFGR